MIMLLSLTFRDIYWNIYRRHKMMPRVNLKIIQVYDRECGVGGGIDEWRLSKGLSLPKLGNGY